MYNEISSILLRAIDSIAIETLNAIQYHGIIESLLNRLPMTLFSILFYQSISIKWGQILSKDRQCAIKTLLENL